MRYSIFFAICAILIACTTTEKLEKNPWLQTAATDGELRRSAQEAAYYLASIQEKNGAFFYIKDPLGKCCPKRRSYRLVDHLNATYALLAAYEVEKDPRMLAAGRAGIDFSMRFVDKASKKTMVKSLGLKPASLMEHGFYLMMLSKYYSLTQDKTYLSLTKRFASFIEKNLQPGGVYQTASGRSESLAIVGLFTYYGAEMEKKPPMERALRYLEYLQNRGKKSEIFIQAVHAAARHVAVKRSLISFALESADSMLANVWHNGSFSHDVRVGSRHGKLVSSGAAMRSEALMAAYSLARGYGFVAEANYLKRRGRENMAFLLQFQYGTKGNLVAKNSKKARLLSMHDMQGGIFSSPSKGYVRIDAVAYHIRAALFYIKARNALATP